MEAAKPTENKTDAMNDSIIAFKAHKQLKRFLGRFSPHFHKPTVQFIGQALYGIQTSGDVKLASWVRMLDEGISAKKVEDGYISRWRVEDAIRYVKQACKLDFFYCALAEGLRLDCDGIPSARVGSIAAKRESRARVDETGLRDANRIQPV